MIEQRCRQIKPGKTFQGPVVYWMSRDQRANDNWALLYAQNLALAQAQPLVVVFCLVPGFLGATLRQYAFMLKGLKEVSATLRKKNIPFILLSGDPAQKISAFLKKIQASTLVTDFDPLKTKRQWKHEVSQKIDFPFWEVDSHNIVPCWIASPKAEYGAYTLRPKIHALLPEFLEEFPKLKQQARNLDLGKGKAQSWDGNFAAIIKTLKIDRSVAEVDWRVPGEQAGQKMLKDFINKKLAFYPDRRNDPNLDGASNLSAYLHFGQIPAQRVAMAVSRSLAPEAAKEAFLEELIVRRELSDNFCFYNSRYDSGKGAPDWAQKTLRLHSKDRREYRYSREELEQGATHDDLWNAAQRQMVKTGKMHGYLRMYWAKKILEWTESPEEAFANAIYLNDKYELDGRDPNGYAGIAWSLAGVHDRAWGERPVFGKIRFMSYNGCKNKFEIKKFTEAC